ncbi:neuroglian-like [Babylonia areolata]|uniref:neuroglian-like n=1 Tax=Babylonia areolata TaxID=304850 RepID=UPI003FD03316
MKKTLETLFYLTLVAQVLAAKRPPSINLQPDYDVFFKSGERVELPCEANGSPSPTYTWKRNGIEFTPGGNNGRVVQLANVGTIVFTKAEDRDEGIFQCFATNAYGVSVSNKVNLREAKLERYGFTRDVTMRPLPGSPLTLNCMPPRSIPPSSVSWVIKLPWGGFEPVTYDARVSMDHEFRLRFTHVDGSDGAGGRPYTCMAMNSILREMTPDSSQYFISPVGDAPQLHPVQYMWASPGDRLGLKGENFTVKCIFSGNPTPEVHWERIGASLPDRARTQSFGQELVIENLQFDDAGTYRCWATNSVTPTRVERTINVRVESRPYWLSEPQDVEVGVGGTAEFNCLANAVPAPAYYWFVNGVPLQDVTDERITSARFTQPCPERIVFTDLTRADDLVIQCNATNKHGYIWGDVFLNVL